MNMNVGSPREKVRELQYGDLVVPTTRLTLPDRYPGEVICTADLPPVLAKAFWDSMILAQIPAVDCAYLHDFVRFMERSGAARNK